jgi:hypothetical protein
MENLVEADEADRTDLPHRATIHSDLGKRSAGKVTRVVFQNQSQRGMTTDKTSQRPANSVLRMAFLLGGLRCSLETVLLPAGPLHQ